MRRILRVSLFWAAFLPTSGKMAVTHLVDRAPPRIVLPAGPAEKISAVAITPDDRWILTLGSEYELKLWEKSTGTDMGTMLVAREAGERGIAVYARGDTQAYVVTSRRVLLVDVPSLVVQQTIRIQGEIGSATLSSDREQLWLGGQDETKMNVSVLRRGKPPIRRVFDMESFSDGSYIRRDGKGIPIVSPDGKYAVPTRSTGEPLRLMRLADRQSVLELAPSTSNRRAAEGSWGTFLANGTLLVCRPAAAEFTWEIDLINPETQQRATRAAHVINSSIPPAPASAPGSTNSPFVVADNRYYVIDGDDLQGPFPLQEASLTAATWHSDPRYASVGMERREGESTRFDLQRLDRATGGISSGTGIATFAPVQIKASSDGRAFYLIDRHRRGRLVQITQRGVAVTPVQVERTVDAVFLSQPGKLAIGGGAASSDLAIVDTENTRDVRKISLGPTPGGRNGGDYLAVSASGRLYVDFHYAEVRIADLASGRELRTIKGGDFGYSARSAPVALSPRDDAAAFFAIEKGPSTQYHLVCYSIASGQLLWKLRGDFGALRYSADGKSLYAVGYHDFAWHLLTLNAATGAIERAVPLPRSELVLNSAYDAEGKTAVVTNGHELQVISLQSGEVLQRIEAPSTKAAAFAGEHFVVTIGAENALRFWDRRTGLLTASLAIDTQGDDWAVIQPSGRFDASEKFRSDLYFVHQGLSIPLDAYLEAFFTPGLGAELVSGASIPAPAFALDDLLRPPSVHLAPANPVAASTDEKGAPQTVSDETFALAIEVEGHGNPVSDLRLYHNGKRVLTRQRNLTVEDDKEEQKPTRVHERRELMLVPGENVFRVVALNSQRTESAPAELRVNYVPAKTDSSPAHHADAATADLHLLVVGLNAYRNPKYNLNYAVADATAVAEKLRAAGAKLFRKTHVHTLFDQHANRPAIVGRLEEIAATARPGDVFIFYYAGHGVMSSATTAEFFLIPHEVTQLYGADDLLHEKALASSVLLEFSQRISAQKQLFLLDACQSAGALNTLATRGGEDKAVAQLARASGTHWITASGSEQFATEFEKLGHGTFTFALLEGLAGKADNGDGRVTVNELKAWLETQVPELTKLHKGTPQYPATYGLGQDFPVVVR